MKVAIFHLGFFYSGGGEKLVLEEVRGLRSLGHQVECFAPYVDRASCFPDYPEIGEVQALLPHPPSWIPMKDPIWILLSCLFVPLMAYRFREYDVFLGANQPGPWLAYVLSKILGKPYVGYLAQPLRLLHPRQVDIENGIHIREGDHKFLVLLRRIGGKAINWADRRSVENASLILTNGSHVGDWIKRVYGIDTVDCPAGCHPSPRSVAMSTNRLDGWIEVNGMAIRRPYILLTNRHSPMKHFEYALWALKSIIRRIDNVSLLVTGQETMYTEQLRYLASVLRIEEHVKFVGLIDEHELRKLYESAGVYVYPSPEEDFGMGIVEAMASGTPVVAWRNGGPTVTVVDRRTGFLVDPYDTDSFAKCIELILENPDMARQMGMAAHQRAIRYFTYEAHNRKLEAALSAAIQDPASYRRLIRPGTESFPAPMTIQSIKANRYEVNHAPNSERHVSIEGSVLTVEEQK